MVWSGWRPRRLALPVVVVLASMWLMVGVSRAAQPLGALTQLSGTAGCFTFNGNSEDGGGYALAGAWSGRGREHHGEP